METLGDFLKREREKAGLTLEDLAGKTRIRIENLDSLEREDLESLPTDPYVRGFVKQVCRELGLEPADGIVRYDALREASSVPSDEITWAEEATVTRTGALERALRDPDRIVGSALRYGRWGLMLVGGGLAIAAAVFLFRWADPLAPRVRGPVAYLAADPAPVPAPELQDPVIPPPVAETPPVAESSPVAEPPPVRRERESARVASEPAASEPAASTPAASQPVAAAPPEAVPVASAPVVPAPSAAEATPTPATPPVPEAAAREIRASASPPAGDRLVLEVTALRAVDVTVLLDGKGHPRRRSLAAGETKRWKADARFVLSASDGGAVRLSLAGEDLGPAGADGQPVRDLSIRPR